ncbi:MAG: glycosyltransferase [Patescibacteria group bacterium]|nr:glycosyltransferase [Patescibacteria group bacterium]
MISIIIPTKNEGKIIEATLNNFKKNFSLPHEIIISDSNSSDNTLEIAGRLADKVVTADPAIKQNIAVGRNAGAAAAQGDFLVFFDADCSVKNPDNFFTIATDDFKKNPRLVALTGWLRVLPEHETFADKAVFILQNIWMMFVNDVLRIGTSPGGEFQMIRTDVFRKLGGYNERLVASEDVELFGRLAKEGRVRLDHRLKVFHTGRRAHQVGWPKLLSLWFMNTVSMMTRGEAYTKEWREVR